MKNVSYDMFKIKKYGTAMHSLEKTQLDMIRIKRDRQEIMLKQR